MEANKEIFGMLDLMIRPSFCVKENEIIKVNAAAEALLITPGTDVRTLLLTGQEEYASFESGCLYLKLILSASGCGASITDRDGFHIFVLDQETDDAQLRCLALAAQELRSPLTSMMISTDRMSAKDDPELNEQLARLNRSLHQMMRIISNMSDAARIPSPAQQETRNLTEVFAEIFEKARHRMAQAGVPLTYQGLQEDVYALADAPQLERAVLNILSNAHKFDNDHGKIHATLTWQGNLLRLSILDSGSGIADNIRSSVFSRYLRQPGIEDGRYGLGLGMVLIRSAAASHGGTVLIDHPKAKGTRITMTLALRQSTQVALRSPVMRVDYAGERDHALVELSDILPVSAYEKEK